MDIDSTLREVIYNAIKTAFIDIKLKPEDIILQAPKAKGHGDIYTTIAMKLAGALNRPASDIASIIRDSIKNQLALNKQLADMVLEVEIKPPGFLNIFLRDFAIIDILRRIQKEGGDFGRCDLARGRRLLIEFVSANPTGPLSVAHGRQAAVGDALANILEFAGWKLTREYFINDQGRQMDMLGESIRSRYLQLLGGSVEFPQDGYKGKYIYAIAQAVIDKKDKKYKRRTKAASVFFREYGCKFIMDIIRGELEDFGVHFDVWTSQEKLTKSGKIQKVFALLKAKGFLYEKDGAAWFKSTAFGDDKDRVVIKSDGALTYLAPDIAYHQDKFQRGFDKLVNIWGPDHHGYVPRIQAAVEALGHPKESITVLIVQLATLYKGKEQVPMSTRSGEFTTLRQVLDDVGKDAARFFFLARKLSSHLDFDIELAKKQSQDNPVYYVQYAHARISNIINFAKTSAAGEKIENYKADIKLLKQPEELRLIKALGDFPGVIATCASAMEPCGLALYLQALSNHFHAFYDRHRVVTDDLDLTRARLVLIDSVRIVIANGLRLLGVSSPEKM